MWKIETGKTGIEAVMKPYQYEIITKILNLGTGITTGEMHIHLKKVGIKISRASVITFLQKLEENGIVQFSEESGKGGMRRVYSKLLDFEEILKNMVDGVLNTILSAFPNGDYIKYIKQK